VALGHRARASVLGRYTVQAMRDATLDVYEAVLGGQVVGGQMLGGQVVVAR
jgi:hypothetical protein